MGKTVQEHYAQPDLLRSILGALEKLGKDVRRLTPDDLAPVDEFHIRGRAATEELFEIAGFTKAMYVLDVGCGIGGPARFLASTVGCRVVGLDLTEEFVRVANELAALVGLSLRTEYRQGDALAMPFEEGTFDAVLMQHASMNIPDKRGLYWEIQRVLKRDGVFAVYEITRGAKEPIHLPVPWASEPRHNHLIPPDELRAMVERDGWKTDRWEDVTAGAREWAGSFKARLSEGGPPPVGLHLILGPTAREKVTNLVANLEEDRIRVVRAILRPA